MLGPHPLRKPLVLYDRNVSTGNKMCRMMRRKTVICFPFHSALKPCTKIEILGAILGIFLSLLRK